MKFTMKLAAFAAAALACAGAFAAGLADPFLQFVGLTGDGATAALLLAEGALVLDVKTVGEQIAAFTKKLGELKEKASAIVAKTISEGGRTLDEHEAEEHEQATSEIKAVEKHLKLLKEQEALMVAKATPVTVETDAPKGAVTLPGAGVISVRRNIEKGTGFVRFVMAVAGAKGNLLQAEKIAERWKDTPEVLECVKAAVNAGTTSATTWAAPLVQYNDLTAEFIELLRNETIIGRMNKLRRVPFNVRIPRQTGGTAGTFVGEGAPTPVQAMAFDNVTLQLAKASTIVVLTTELARFSDPSAEALVRSDLMAGISEYLDKRLIDPAYPGVANVSPASLTNGVTPRQATGATLAALDADVRYVMTVFADANLGLQSGVWVMSASSAIRLSMMRTNQDSKAFPDLSVNGGTFYGLPVIVSNSVTGSGSPGDQFLILVNQNEVLLADDGQIMIDASSEASVQMNDAPSAGAQSLVSLWQNGLLGVKVERFINWTKRRSQAVQFIDKAQSYAS